MRQSSDTSSEGQRDRCELDPTIRSAIEYVAQYMGKHDDWVDIKIEIMNGIRPELRRMFSRRDPHTREQVPNTHDLAVIEEYHRVSGVRPIVRTLAERRAMRSGIEDE